MNIALFGGSFNPVHKGHIKLVKDVKNEFNIDKIIIMPTGITPLKDNSNFAKAKDRYNMCCLAFENIDFVVVSDYEINKQGESYTYLTLNYLKELYPNDKLYLIVGADMFYSLEKWKNFKDIFSIASIIAVPRDCEQEDLNKHSLCLKDKYNCTSAVMSHRIMDISSTEIRSIILENNNIDNLVDKNVLKYIKENHLYGV